VADEEHVRKIREGAERWNEWRRSNPTQRIDLANADLQGLNLTNFDFYPSSENIVRMPEGIHDVMSIGTNFAGADLRRARLCSANLKGAKFDRANLHSVNFSNAKLLGANFSGATLVRAVFFKNNLQGSSFTGAFMGEALFDSVDLRGAEFSSSKLDDARFTNADVKGARFSGAILKGADLRGARNLLLDQTYIKDAHFYPRAKDPWSVLRRSYTGPKFTFILLALIAFAIPYIGRIGFWSFVNLGQGYTQAIFGTIKQRAQEQGIDDQTIAMLGLSHENITALSQCLSEECVRKSAWQLMLGADQNPISIGFISFPFWLLPALLLLYNICRGILTALVAPMRDAEERSGYSPIWSRVSIVNNEVVSPRFYQKGWWQGYQPLYCMHKIVSALGTIAILAFFINGWYWMFQVIYLPA
jgi:hypothetical protein